MPHVKVSPASRHSAAQRVSLVLAGTDEVRKELSWEIHSSLPTLGLLVPGCIDDCDVCEPELQREIELELEHKSLRNQLLKRQIELLDKAQEYRCCPVGEDEVPTP